MHTVNDYREWLAALVQKIEQMEDAGVEASHRMLTPATNEEIDRAEKDLALKFPKSLRESLLAIRGQLSWDRGDEGEDNPEKILKELPEELYDEYWSLTGGFMKWNVESVIEAELSRQSYFDDVIDPPKNARDRAWQNKLGIMSAQDGDYLALDLEAGDDPPVVILMRDGNEPHGDVVAPTLGEFFREWFAFACVTPSVSSIAVIMDDFELPFSIENEHLQPWLAWLNDF